MRVAFAKQKRGLCMWTAYPPKRRPVSAFGGGSTGTSPLPHDLAQLVVERELGVEHGFWGCVAAGASFRTLVRGGRKRTRPGVEIIRAHVTEIDAAEHLFHRHVGHWIRGEETPARGALDEALAAWRSIGEHESIDVEFPIGTAQRARGAQRPRRARQARRARR